MTDNRDAPGDHELVEAAKAGDRTAFAVLYAKYARMVHGIAISHVPVEDAQDVVQEVFLRALADLGHLREEGAFGAWLASIARHLSVDVLRRRRRLGESDREPAAPGNPHDEFEARAALHAIRELPRAYRETLMLRLVEGLTGPEIAERTGLTPASVRVNLHRGMKLLRARLKVVDEVVS